MIDITAFKVPDGPGPEWYNPSLWRMAQLNSLAGLFQVVDRIYQVRNIDTGNLTLIEGDTGLILMDPLVSSDAARMALALYSQHRPKKPVVAVIYTHSHIDHFGGVRGVVDEKDYATGKVQIVAPHGFTEEAVSENLMTGNAMFRRATYAYGMAPGWGPGSQQTLAPPWGPGPLPARRRCCCRRT